MIELIATIFVGVVLTALLAAALAYASRKYGSPVRGRALFLLGLPALTLLGGFIGGFPWWFDVQGSFAWDTPPLASRMLASAAWSFALLSFTALQRPSHRRLRLYLWMLAVYMLPLTIAIMLFHLDRFDFSVPFVWSFFFIVVILDFSAVFFLLRQPEIVSAPERDRLPSSIKMKTWLGLVFIITIAWSLALFTTDQGPIAAIWAWKGDLLSSRLIGAMLATLAAGALYAFPRRDTSLVVLATTAAYGIGLAIASAWNILAGKPVNALYMFVFGSLGLGSAMLWLAELARGHGGEQPSLPRSSQIT